MTRIALPSPTLAPLGAGLLALCFLLTGAVSVRAAAPIHPLDPLSHDEHWAVLDALREAGHFDAGTRFSGVRLVEPPKDQVWSWQPGAGPPRSAWALVRQGDSSYEAVIDLRAHRVTSWTELRGVQPAFLQEELFEMVEEVLQHPEFVAGLRRRGYEDLTFLDCVGIPPGNLGTPEERGRRIAHIRCSDTEDVANSWPREIPGLTAVVDIGSREILQVVDEGPSVAPLASITAEYAGGSAGPPREGTSPVRFAQPGGRGFTLDGHLVEWQRWSFHVRPDARVGTVVSLVRYDDAGARRPILYQGHLSEIFVPYMSPSFAWSARNFIDAGEFSVIGGGLLKPLLPGRDCPEGAAYFDLVLAGDNGRPRTTSDTICIFERYAGDMAWRHGLDPSAGYAEESRPKQDLVVRSAAVIGNYDYVLDWVFQQDGTLRVAVGATGIVESEAVAQAGAASPSSAPTAAAGVSSGSAEVSPLRSGLGAPNTAAPVVRAARARAARSADVETTERPDAYGRFVAPHIVAINHDHYFSFRLDLDVDGPTNDFQIDRLVAKTLPPGQPRRSLWVQEPAVARREHDARLEMDMHRPALWRVTSAQRTNAVGYPTSYQLLPGMGAHTLLSADDYPRRRAGFIDHDLWVTPYSEKERYAAGDHPTLSEPGAGLPEWTKQNRAIADTDIVLWHTIGVHHVVRAEDWPVMPVMWHSFELRPFDFFDRNPALDLPNER